MIVSGSRVGHYEILDRIGEGGMGEVWLAEDTRLDRRVALKLLPPALVSDEQAKKRLLREAKSAAILDHPNICAIYEVGEENGRSFIAMQFVEGETLAARIERAQIDIHDALDIADQVVAAFATAHSRGIIHRDIKPQNMMIAGSGLVKVLDFGLAKRIYDRTSDASEAETASLLTEIGLIMGTVPYMSPEQVRAESLDARSDIFSFGAVLYEMLSGKRPFVAKSTAELISAILTLEPAPLRNQTSPIPARMDRLVRRCLAKDPASRYQTMDELKTELKALRRSLESGQFAGPLSEAPKAVSKLPIKRETKWRGLLHSRLALGLSVVILVLVASIYAFFSRLPEKTSTATYSLKANSSPAYDSYLRGKVMVNSENREDNETAIRLLEQAVSEDRNFAPAYVELARAYNLRAFYFAPASEQKQLNLDAKVLVEQALALDQDLAEAHSVRGLILWTPIERFPHEQAIQSFKRAIALNAKLDDPHHQLGVIYFHIGLLDKAWAEIEKALENKPDNTMARFRFGVINIYRGRYEEALAVFKSTPREVNPSIVERNVATALFQLGKMYEASAVVEEYLTAHPDDEGGNVTSVKAMLLAKAGKPLEAEETIQHAIKIGRTFGHFHHTAYNIASAYALMNKPEEAVKWLETAADDGFPCYPFFEKDANLNSLRKNERFITLMNRLRKQWEAWQKTL